jgi:hypothetical protein
MLSHHASSAAPQTVQTAPPVCGAKNLSSVRLYSAPQLHRTIVAILGICAQNSQFSSPDLCHNQTDSEEIRRRTVVSVRHGAAPPSSRSQELEDSQVLFGPPSQALTP